MKTLNACPLICITYSHPFLFFLLFFSTFLSYSQNQNFVIDNSFPFLVNDQTLGRTPIGGDTIFISSARTNPLKFQLTNGNANAPLVVINKGGQVKIESPYSYSWGAITFEKCKYIKISGAGHPNFKYGFELSADECGLAFSDLSSDCEAEFIKINHDGFYGIMAKKNYDGNPPVPYPVFENLIIHDCFIENVSEGMYLGETMSPGMEFKHVKIYNNIVRNTLRESIQIANMVEDVEIYNNTLLNAGLENLIYHTNVLQIGNNSVVNAYNNILEEAPESGIVIFGKGNCIFTNNYIASNTGIFADNRSISDSLAPLDIKQNYFRSTIGNQIIKNYNESNFVTVQNNNYDTNLTFFLNQSGNSNNYTVSNNTLGSVPKIEFTDPSTNDYSLTQNNPIEYQNMGAPSGPEYFDPIPEQIIISPSMVLDSVNGGSLNSPILLFDEQNLSIENNEHPTSLSWKPFYNMNNAPYHVIIDLGKHYYISEINLHDMHNTFEFTVEHGDSVNWTPLFVDPCNTYNSWSSHTTNITTRFLRLSMLEDVYASVNEMIIYGYPATIEAEQIIITSNMVTDLVPGGSAESPLFLFDEQNLNHKMGEHAISNSWKPYWSMANAPYYTVIDLGQEYHISEINLHDMNETHDFSIEYGNATTWTTLLVDSLDKFNLWNSHQTDIYTRYLRLSMPVSPYAAVNEITFYGFPTVEGLEPEPEPGPENNQIIVLPNMITDVVPGGSVNSPLFLFDEQSIDFQSGQHATSNSWKPDYTMNNTSYHTEVDLGQVYNISEINLHDMHATYDFTIEYGDGTNWTTLFIDPCDTYNTWSINTTNIATRYLRLSMYQDINAYVNEIFIFGHVPVSSNKSANSKKKESHINSNSQSIEKETFGFNNIQLYPNPIDKNLNIKFPAKMIGKSNISIKDILGKIVFKKNVLINKENTSIEFKNSEINLVSGYYILHCQHESGEFQSLQFIKE